MSREIKFRAWVKPGELTNHVNGVIADAKPNFYESDCLIERLDLTGKKNFREIFDFDRIELMQYTGLNDQFNTEIYEGDVVRHDFMVYEGHGSVGEDSTIDIIKNLTELPFGSSSIGCEIIGNIYENPELLEAKL